MTGADRISKRSVVLQRAPVAGQVADVETSVKVGKVSKTLVTRSSAVLINLEL